LSRFAGEDQNEKKLMTTDGWTQNDTKSSNLQS